MKQKGFTLIELVIVIVILGILAATALPKFVDLGKDARAAAMRGVEASLRATNALIYAKASIGNSMGSASSVVISGNTIETNYGFAEYIGDNATANTTANGGQGIERAMDISPAGDFTFTYAAGAGSIRHKGATTPANCSISYTAATATATPVYALDTSGC